MNDQDSSMAANAICHAAAMAAESIRQITSVYGEPAVFLKPRLFLDGNQWCVLHGKDLQEGLAAFGDSPSEAMYAFNQAYYTRVPKATE